MSFSEQVKEELSKLSTLANKQLVRAELMGYLVSNNTTFIKNKIQYSTENEYNINRLHKLLKNLEIPFEITIQGKVYKIQFSKLQQESICCVSTQIPMPLQSIEKQEENWKKAFIRGSFMGSGSITNPDKTYHLEILFPQVGYLKYVQQALSIFEIHAKVLEKRGNSYCLYLKEGEEIANMLALMGANAAVLKFEEIRVIRDMRNSINRKVNCETANLNKIVNASIKQIQDIQYLQEQKEFHKLPSTLQEVAILRMENPEMSLLELGKLLPQPIGKSGVNHRLKKIMEIADEIRKEKNEEE